MSKSALAEKRALARHLKTVLPVAVVAALQAGAIIKRKFGKFRNLTLKPDASLVTEVDKQSEKAVIGVLKKRFPRDQIVGEESGLTKSADLHLPSSFRWHIDPLDGTTNFVHGFPMFCVSIGLEHENQGPVLGVIYHPLTEDLYTTYRGAGAFRNKKRISVSKTPKLNKALLSTGFSISKEHSFDQEIAAFGRLTRASYAIRRTGSAALDLTMVATGQFDGFWERGLHSWDVTAALALLIEAGGHYSQFDGKEYRIGDQTLVASNRKIHQEFTTAISG